MGTRVAPEKCETYAPVPDNLGCISKVLMAIQRVCKTCGTEFFASNTQVKNGYGKFCKASCYFQSEEVKVAGRQCRGKPRSEETIRKISLAKIGKPSGRFGMKLEKNQGIKHFAWKGNKVGYRALHSWIERKLGKPDHCEFCNQLPPVGKGIKRSYFQWANKSHLYKREESDWLQLCYKCHQAFDRKVTAI